MKYNWLLAVARLPEKAKPPGKGGFVLNQTQLKL